MKGDRYIQVIGVPEEETQKGTQELLKDTIQENFFEVKEDVNLCNERTYYMTQSIQH